MKFFIVLGGFFGFALVMGVGLAAGRRSLSLLLEASAACVLGAMLFRWWHALLVRGVRTALAEKLAAAEREKKTRAPERATSVRS